MAGHHNTTPSETATGTDDLAQTQAVLADAFTRADESVEQLTSSIDEVVARYRPDPEANSIAWLIWHSARIMDHHVAELAGLAQEWDTWRTAFDLPFPSEATGYGQRSADIKQVPADLDKLRGYFHAAFTMTLRYIDNLTANELNRVVDTAWDPPVTASVRLVSVLGDITQHIGQAAYIKGLAERADAD